jgi:protein associated with RNAse G/E
VLEAESAVRVRKLRPDGSEVFAWNGAVLRCDASGIVLRAEFNVDEVVREYATFRRGDVFVEFYYWARAYNVFQVSAADGALKGWYANLGLPAELDAEHNELRYVDLALDVWVAPDGSSVVLDEDELAEMVEQFPHVAEIAEIGRKELIELARTGPLPRWP